MPASRQTIVSPLFRNQGKLSPLMMKKLTIRGGGIQLDDCLQRFGWSPNKGVATTVMTIDEDSGAVKGVRFECRGQGPQIKFKAKELWANVNEDITVVIKVSDLSRLPFLTVGDRRNQTSWMDSKEVEFEANHGERGTLTTQEMIELGIEGFCLRFTLLPVKVDKMLLYGSIFPQEKDKLVEKLIEMEELPESQHVPTVAMKLWVANGKYQNGFPLDFLPVEQKEDRIGLGHLPLLECIGSTAPVLPSHDEIARQLKNFLQNLNPTNNVNIARMRSVMNGSSLPQTTTGLISYGWPDYVIQGRNTPAGSEDTPTGLCFGSIHANSCKFSVSPQTVTATDFSIFHARFLTSWVKVTKRGPKESIAWAIC